MPRPARPWFRFYVEALSDRKLRRLTPAQRWLWVAILGAARQSTLPGWLLVSIREPMNAADLADIAGMSEREVARALPLFEQAEMICRDSDIGAWRVVNWTERQYESDSSAERTRKYRAKEQGGDVTTASPVTAPEAEEETDPQSPPCATCWGARVLDGREDEPCPTCTRPNMVLVRPDLEPQPKRARRVAS